MRRDAAQPSYEEVVAENAALYQRIAELEAALEQLEAARRAGKRQAVPFSKEPPREHPKRPGRPVGHAPAQREQPRQHPQAGTRRVLEVTLAHASCLRCGGELIDQTIQVQYQHPEGTRVPPVRPIVTQFNIESARCGQCGQRVQARHPEQTSDARGAAAVQIGPRALGLAAELKHGLGAPYRKHREVPGTCWRRRWACGWRRGRWPARASG